MFRTPPAHLIDWDTISDHLDEAGDWFEIWSTQLDSWQFTAHELFDRVEVRWSRHVDALRLGGDVVWNRELEPILSSPDDASPAALAVATVLSLQRGQAAKIVETLARSQNTEARAALIAGCAAQPCTALDSKVAELWAADASRERDMRVACLQLAAALGVDLGELVPSGTWGDEDQLACTLDAARRSSAVIDAPWLRQCVEHPSPAIRERALLLALGGQRRLADREFAAAISLPETLSDATWREFGYWANAEQTSALVQQLARAQPTTGILAAVGSTGTAAAFEVLLDLLDCEDPRLRRAAASAFARIVGLDLCDHDLHASNDDDDGDSPEGGATDELDKIGPELDSAAVQSWWKGERGRFDSDQRHILGQPRSIINALELFAHASVRERHDLARIVAIADGDRHRLSTRARYEFQERELRSLRAAQTP